MSSRLHVARGFEGTEMEDKCPCPQEPCGFVSEPVLTCQEHATKYSRTMRQIHNAGNCPGVRKYEPWPVVEGRAPRPMPSVVMPRFAANCVLEALLSTNWMNDVRKPYMVKYVRELSEKLGADPDLVTPDEMRKLFHHKFVPDETMVVCGWCGLSKNDSCHYGVATQ